MPTEVAEHTPSLKAYVALCLTLMGYDAKRSSDDACFEFRMKLESGERPHGRIVVLEEERVVRFCVLVSHHYAPQRQRWVADLVNVANEELSVFGFFVLGSEGELYHHIAEEFSDSEVTPQDIERLMNRVAFPVAVFSRALRHAGTRRQTSPVIALRAALAENQALDATTVGSNVRRAMLELMA